MHIQCTSLAANLVEIPCFNSSRFYTAPRAPCRLLRWRCWPPVIAFLTHAKFFVPIAFLLSFRGFCGTQLVKNRLPPTSVLLLISLDFLLELLFPGICFNLPLPLWYFFILFIPTCSLSLTYPGVFCTSCHDDILPFCASPSACMRVQLRATLAVSCRLKKRRLYLAKINSAISLFHKTVGTNWVGSLFESSKATANSVIKRLVECGLI